MRKKKEQIEARKNARKLSISVERNESRVIFQTAHKHPYILLGNGLPLEKRTGGEKCVEAELRMNGRERLGGSVIRGD